MQAEMTGRAEACAAAVREFCGVGEVVALAPVPTFTDHVATARSFREHLFKECDRTLCAVCCVEKSNITQLTIGLDKSTQPTQPVTQAALPPLPNSNLLLADLPPPPGGQHPPEAPRHAHTVATIAGKRYCLHPAGVNDHLVNTCATCLQALRNGALPEDSLVCIDPGPRPSTSLDPSGTLPPLRFFEERLVSIIRPSSKIVFVIKPQGGCNLPPDARQQCSRGHIIAFPSTTPQDLHRALLRPLGQVPDDIQVIFLNFISGKDNLVERASQQTCKAICVRGKVVLMWAEHLSRVSNWFCHCAVELQLRLAIV